MSWPNNHADDGSLDFFISYSPADERWATWIAGTLEDEGYRTMLQVWDFVPGTNFIDFMDRGVSEATAVIAVLSRPYLQSRYGRIEWQAALRADPDAPARKLITVRVEDCPLEGLLATITYVDLVGVTDAAQARALILARVGEALAGRAKLDGGYGFPNATGTGVLPSQRPAQPVQHVRRTRFTVPAFPASLPVERSSLSLLHIAGPCFGRTLAADGTPYSASDLQSRIFADLTDLLQSGAPDPDLLVVSGDLTASASRNQFEEALSFLTGMRVLLGLEPSRLLVVPGGADVNRAASRAYFADCEADDIEPRRPYWPKWKHFTRLFAELYQGIDSVIFTKDQPWTLFALPDLRLVVAGFNSSMAISHREEEQYGWLGDEQAAWFTQRLKAYENAGWLRVGLMRHAIGGGVAGLRDLPSLNRLAPRLNLLLHGPGPDTTLEGDLITTSVARPGQYELLEITAEGLTRWSDNPTAPQRYPGPWQAAGATFVTAGPVETPAGDEPVNEDDPRVRANPTQQLLDRVAEVCQARFERASIRRVDAALPYLVVTYTDSGFTRQMHVTGLLGEPTREQVEEFRQQLYTGISDIAAEIVYQGSRPPQQLRDEALRSGVRLRSFVEFQGLIDLGPYVAAQSVRLRNDLQYPPRLYVPQRYRDLDRPDRGVAEGLVEEMLSLLGGEHGRFILLLGDFGRGKTFALREVAQRIPLELPHLIPILIELRALDKAHSIDGLVAAHLANHGEETIDLKAFRYLLAQGRIVLLFDGFDELATRVSYDAAADHLDTLLSAATDSAKIVVSSRTQHFKSHAQVLTALGQRVELLPHRRVLSVEDFTPQQIRTYLVNHYGDDEKAADARLRLIRGVEDLSSLARNPRMLGFVADLDPDRLRSVAQAGQALSAAGLYREILSAWLAYEARRTSDMPGSPAGLGLDDLWQAVTKLAMRLWQTNESVLRLTDLDEIANTLTGLASSHLTPQQRAQAVGAGSLLVRTDDGQFGFIHNSVAEWLVANEISAQLSRGEATVLSVRPLSSLCVDFLCDLADPRVCQNWANGVAAGPTTDSASLTNALRISSRLRVHARSDLRGASLRGEDLSYREFTGVDLTGADLTNARLIGVNLTGARLTNARLTGARLDEAVLARADLTGADLSLARLTRADLRGATVDGSGWQRASLISTVADDDLFTRPELRGAAIWPGMAIRTELAPATVGVPYGFHSLYGRLPDPLAYSSDGATLAIGGDDGSVLLCDSVTGAPVRTFACHVGRVYSVAFGSDDNTLITGAHDATVRISDVTTGEIRHVLSGHQDWVWPVAVSRPRHLIATGDGAGEVRIWDAQTGALRHRLGQHVAPVWSATFAPNGTTLATAGADSTIRIWDVISGELVYELAGPGGSTYRLAYSPDGTQLAAADAAGSVRVWEAATGTLVSLLTGHASAVYTMDFHPGGHYLASADTLGSIRIWDVRTGAEAAVLTGHLSSVYWVLFAPDGTSLASGGSDGSVRLWTVTVEGGFTATLSAELSGHLSAVWPFAFRPDGAQLATSSNDYTTRLWDTATGQCRRILRGHRRRISSVSFNAAGSVVAACGNDGAVRLWNPVSGRLVRRLEGIADQLTSAVFSPVGALLATASNDGGVYLWNADAGTAERELDVETVSVWAEAFSPDGTLLATANDDDSVRLWHRGSGAHLHTLTEHRGRVRSIAFSPDGHRIVTGCDDSKVRTYDVDSGACLSTWEGHADRVYSVAYHPRGDLIASASWDGTACVWRAADGALVHRLFGHTGKVWTAAFDRGGDLLATAGDDFVVRLWDSRTGAVMAVLEGHTGRIYTLAFGPTRAELVTGGDDGTVRLWDLTQLTAPVLRVTMVGLAEGWAAVAPDGRYKSEGETAGEFWYVIGASRFEPGELDDFVPEVRRLADDAAF